MRKIIFLFFVCISLISYPQKKNEYGLKMVKSITEHEHRFKNYVKREFDYDANGKTTSFKIFNKNENDKEYSLLKSYVLDGDRINQTDSEWDGNKFILVKNRNHLSITLNDKGHISKITERFPGEEEVWTFVYDDGISIYDENVVRVDYVETYFSSNLLPKSNGKPADNHVAKTSFEYSYTEPLNPNFIYNRLNDTNINLRNMMSGGIQFSDFTNTSWLPYYNPWVTVATTFENGPKYEYHYDDNHNITKIEVFWWQKDHYRLIKSYEIEYVY